MKTAEQHVSLTELARIFLRLGATAFGGPAAHIALMEEEVVRKRQWLTREEFLDLLGITNLIPGPNSTEMAIHIGHRKAGWKGLLVAGACFILPAFLLVWGLAWGYQEFGTLARLRSVFESVKPVILAVMAQAIWNLSRSAVKDAWLGFMGFAAFGLYLAWGNELSILAIVALVNLLFRKTSMRASSHNFFIGSLFSALLLSSTAAFAILTAHAAASGKDVFWYFAKVGSVLYGSGYVLIAFLQNDLVSNLGWISATQLVDAIAVGQFTPGPVFTTATFIGFLAAGHEGAVLATLGIFAPAFLFVALSAPIVPWLRRSSWASPLLDGLNVASLSLLCGAAFVMAQQTFTSAPLSVLGFALSFILLVFYKVNSAWLIVVAALLGVVI